MLAFRFPALGQSLTCTLALANVCVDINKATRTPMKTHTRAHTSAYSATNTVTCTEEGTLRNR